VLGEIVVQRFDRQPDCGPARGDGDGVTVMKRLGLTLVLLALAACGGGGGGTTPPSGVSTPVPTPAPTASAPAGSSLPGLPLALNVNNLPGQFYGELVAQFTGVSPRQMVMLPNGDLLIGTGGGTANFPRSGQIYILQNAEAAVPAAPTVFATLADGSCASSAGTNTNGITFAAGTGGGTIFVGMECSVWKIPYATGDHVASSQALFVNVRTGSTVSTPIDSDVHHTTSVLAAGSTLYISVGSSCNACTETDPTRGAILKSSTTTPALSLVATRVRNAMALAQNPATGTVWAGGAGQDCVVGTTCFAAMDALYLDGHPYEWMDPLTTHTAPVDYMWPWCEENMSTVSAPDGTPATPPPGTNCTNMIVAPVRAPAYATIIGATFYAPPAGATYAFPSSFQNGLFFTLHGSWHEGTNGVPVAVPEVVFVPMSANDAPAYPMDWVGGSPYSNWARNGSGNPAPFMNGFQQAGVRIGKPAGLAVGNSGSLFISDDDAGVIYRIRPGFAPASVQRAKAPGSTLRR
jgi:glucose/arabinose dehydrogenase